MSAHACMRMLASALILVAAAACGRHKDIECTVGLMRQVTVSFDWQKAPEASPEGMRVYFFPTTSSGRIWCFDIAGRDGGPVEVPTGVYHLLAFNNDLPGVRFDDSDGTCDDFSALAPVSESTRSVKSTGMLYGAHTGYLEVTPCGVAYLTESGQTKECGKSVVRCVPDSMATLFTVLVKEVSGIGRMRSASSSIHSVATAMAIATAQCSPSLAPLLVPMNAAHGAPQLSASGSGFLPEAYAESRYELELAVTRTDGKSFSRTYPITDQVLNPISPRHVIIVIDSLDIPAGDLPPDTGGDVGGIAVDVDGWHAVEIEVGTQVDI